MRLATAYVRFYRAFNYDYLRKAHRDFRPDPWDILDEGPAYPYVRIPIDSELTCIVGANEAGKSQLLDAIQLALGSKPLGPTDLCRYSEFFTVSGAPRVPDVGLHFNHLTDEESTELQGIIGLPDSTAIKSFKMFKVHPERILIYVRDDEEPVDVSGNGKALASFLPKAVRIYPTYELPDSVPIGVLVPSDNEGSTNIGLDRYAQLAITNALMPVVEAIRNEEQESQDHSNAIDGLVGKIRESSAMSQQDRSERLERLQLARNLLVEIAGISPQAFGDLQAAPHNGGQGFASAIETEMNRQLDVSLNLSKWWSQDSEFRLEIGAQDHQLLLTVSDRTGSQYTFDERSHGLKYFLDSMQLTNHSRTEAREPLPEPFSLEVSRGLRASAEALQSCAT